MNRKTPKWKSYSRTLGGMMQTRNLIQVAGLRKKAKSICKFLLIVIGNMLCGTGRNSEEYLQINNLTGMNFLKNRSKTEMTTKKKIIFLALSFLAAMVVSIVVLFFLLNIAPFILFQS